MPAFRQPSSEVPDNYCSCYVCVIIVSNSPTLGLLDATASDNLWIFVGNCKQNQGSIYRMCLRWTLMCACETRARERERERKRKKLFRHTIQQQFVCQVLTKSNHFRVWGVLFSFILLQSRLRCVIHPCCPPGHSCANAREAPSSACQMQFFKFQAKKSSSNYLPKYCELVVANHTHPYGG